MTLFDKAAGSVWRNLIRAVLTAVTAFGFDMSGDQVAAIMLVTEAVLAAGTLLTSRRKTNAARRGNG